MQLQLTAKSTPVTSTARSGDRGAKYLAFYLGHEEYGVDVMKVREIIGIQDITAVPHSPGYVKGVINLRGKVIPVLDLRQKLGMTEIAHSPSTCIIVIQSSCASGASLTGIIVDGVLEVFAASGADVQAPPDFGAEAQIQLVVGMTKVKDKLRILLDVTQITDGDRTLPQKNGHDERGT